MSDSDGCSKSDTGNAPKEMLSMTTEGDQTHVKINFSSLDLIQTCPRKAYYTLVRKIRGGTSPALMFGTAVHKALESWYLTPLEQRIIPTNALDKAKLHLYSSDRPFGPDSEVPMYNAIHEFIMHSDPNVPDSDKRCQLNGIKILVEYFKRYKDDGLTVVSDSKGPMVERRVEFPIHVSPDLKITYFGTVDVILENKQTGVVMVVDHKTTSALGSGFYNRVKPNHQYTGYVQGAQVDLGLDTNLFMINGLQVAKTKYDFARQVTERTEEDFEELKNAVLMNVRLFMTFHESGIWPQNAPQPCTMYGSCKFLKACEVPSNIRESVIRSLEE